jgi:hypothetical protein
MSEVTDIATAKIMSFADWMLPQILELAREMHRESAPHRDMTLDEPKILAQVKSSNPDVFFRAVVRGPEVLGGFFGAITETAFFVEKGARELLWFIRKSRRGSMAAVMLVRDFEAWATARGARTFFLSQSTAVEIEQTRRLYEKLGYLVCGVNTFKKVA